MVVVAALDFAKAHSNLANLYAQADRRVVALRAYVAAIRAAPGDWAAVFAEVARELSSLGS